MNRILTPTKVYYEEKINLVKKTKPNVLVVEKDMRQPKEKLLVFSACKEEK